MGKKLNIFGGVKFWGRFSLSLPRAVFKNWDLAAWFWFIVLGGIVAMGIGAVIVAAIGDPTPVVPVIGGWDG